MNPKGLAAALAAAPPGPIGVAVSGGGDSVALLLLLHSQLRGHGSRPLSAITIDHGLRSESAAEADAVAALCAARGIPHAVRRWGGAGSGNLQSRARDARRALIAAWAHEGGIAAVALGHTLDDQAETFLMRLARGSGVDGLSAMAPVATFAGLVWLRPLLATRRAALREWLAAQGVRWSEDPGNTDERFDRVRARATLPLVEPLGIGPERLAATAAAMARARKALERATAERARACVTVGAAGDAEIEEGEFAEAPDEIGLRLLAGTLCWVAGARYRPRLVQVEAALEAIRERRLGHGLTLHGCVLRPRRGRVAIRREPARVAPPAPLAAGVWDGRWRLVERPQAADASLAIGALGRDGLEHLPGWRAAGLAREALITTPAVWRDGTLVAAPLVQSATGYAFRRVSELPPPWALAIMR